MEHISETLKKKTPINTSKADTDTPSDAEEVESSSSFNCSVCNGAGFIYPLLTSEKPDYSRVILCRCSEEETHKERRARLEHYSNLGSLKRLTFDNLILQGRSGYAINQEQFKRACESAKAFASNPQGWLILIGLSGCGKTHLASAIAGERISHGYPAFFITVADLMDHLRSAFSPNSDIPYDMFFSQVRNAPLLILDDLNAQIATPWAKEKLDQLLNHRSANELPTVITTNTPVQELEVRIRTRLSDPRLCQVYTLEEKQVDGTLDYAWDHCLELQKSMVFANFDWRRVNLPLEQQQNLEQAFRLALDFAKLPENWLVFLGANGCGKTHLAAAIINYRYQAGKAALFMVVPEFLDHLRSTFSPDSKISYDQLFERVKATPLLVLDDFGEQTATSWAQEKLYQVINYRYNARLATVLTTCRSLEEIERRISSRLADPKISTPFNIVAPDYRGDIKSDKQIKNYRRTRKSRYE
jgi:DNA replication protein DnaC